MIIRTETYWRDDELGTQFQAACRSREWKSALIIYEKYKRKFNLDFPDLKKIREYAIDFSEERARVGKRLSDDFLTQELSVYVKKNFSSSQSSANF